MSKIISILAFLSFNTVLEAATLNPKLHQSQPDGGLISATVDGMSPNLTVKLYNMIADRDQKLLGIGTANSQGFLQFPSVFILNRDSKTLPGKTGHYVTLTAVDGSGRSVTHEIWLN
ncbi:MAG: hypothetical protein WCK49_01990 [Myxococcaceae bacterium]